MSINIEGRIWLSTASGLEGLTLGTSLNIAPGALFLPYVDMNIAPGTNLNQGGSGDRGVPGTVYITLGRRVPRGR